MIFLQPIGLFTPPKFPIREISNSLFCFQTRIGMRPWTGRTYVLRSLSMISTFLTAPSSLGITFTILTFLHSPRLLLSSTSTARSPSRKSPQRFNHFVLGPNVGTISCWNLVQKCVWISNCSFSLAGRSILLSGRSGGNADSSGVPQGSVLEKAFQNRFRLRPFEWASDSASTQPSTLLF